MPRADLELDRACYADRADRPRASSPSSAFCPGISRLAEMALVNVHQAKTHLCQLLQKVRRGSQVPRANADPHRLQQCLTALVDNALLYSDGPVTLAASTGPAGELVLHVIDRGPARPAWPAPTAALASASRWCAC